MSDYLECPCCGDEGAVSDAEGLFTDEQALICGCPGHVSVSEDEGPYVWINEDVSCPRCAIDE
jgi:hypothetical protein